MSVTFESVRKSHHRNSRYKNLYRFIDRNGKRVIETYEKLYIKPHSSDLFHEVKSGEENFLDLIAYTYYKNEGLWWVIAEANQLINPLYVPAGTVLRVPSVANLRGYEGVLA